MTPVKKQQRCGFCRDLGHKTPTCQRRRAAAAAAAGVGVGGTPVPLSVASATPLHTPGHPNVLPSPAVVTGRTGPPSAADHKHSPTVSSSSSSTSSSGADTSPTTHLAPVSGRAGRRVRGFVRCSICHRIGHNKQTCARRCPVCSSMDHLPTDDRPCPLQQHAEALKRMLEGSSSRGMQSLMASSSPLAAATAISGVASQASIPPAALSQPSNSSMTASLVAPPAVTSPASGAPRRYPTRHDRHLTATELATRVLAADMPTACPTSGTRMKLRSDCVNGSPPPGEEKTHRSDNTLRRSPSSRRHGLQRIVLSTYKHKVAIVIGINEYGITQSLRNCINDARNVAEALQVQCPHCVT